jgi:hypothetical protein
MCFMPTSATLECIFASLHGTFFHVFRLIPGTTKRLKTHNEARTVIACCIHHDGRIRTGSQDDESFRRAGDDQDPNAGDTRLLRSQFRI